MPPIDFNYTSTPPSNAIAFGGPPMIALDYDRSESNQSFITNSQFVILLLYGVVIPFFLFVLSRLIRCLRRHDFISISENSEECILDSCQQHLHQGINSAARPLVKNSHVKLKAHS
jgi:hypothetical protein